MAVGAYSPRARERFPVAAPVTWAQVERGSRHFSRSGIRQPTLPMLPSRRSERARHDGRSSSPAVDASNDASVPRYAAQVLGTGSSELRLFPRVVCGERQGRRRCRDGGPRLKRRPAGRKCPTKSSTQRSELVSSSEHEETKRALDISISRQSETSVL
jgi:hypothetical protein